MKNSVLYKKNVKKIDGITNRLIFFFIFLLLITIAGFYKTYLVKFPNFKGFTWVHHFHGAVMLLWILMLIIQPVLIKTKRIEMHRIVGMVSYFIFPLLVFSFFLVSRASYLRNIVTVGEIEALSGMTNGIPDMFYISILYGFGLYYKKRTSYHIRFFASIGLMILGPGLGRFLIVFCGFPPMIAILSMMGCIAIVALVWMLNDRINRKSEFPMAVFLTIIAITFYVIPNSHSFWWQHFAKCIATNFF